jgi:hypothetical protein
MVGQPLPLPASFGRALSKLRRRAEGSASRDAEANCGGAPGSSGRRRNVLAYDGLFGGAAAGGVVVDGAAGLVELGLDPVVDLFG